MATTLTNKQNIFDQKWNFLIQYDVIVRMIWPKRL